MGKNRTREDKKGNRRKEKVRGGRKIKKGRK